MGYWNLDGAYVCECMCSKCEDDYYYGSPRSYKRFTPPSLRDFLLELVHELSEEPNAKAALKREERAQNRASTLTVAIDAGMNRPTACHCPVRQPW